MGCYRQLTSEELGDLERKVAYIEGFRMIRDSGVDHSASDSWSCAAPLNDQLIPAL